MFKPLHRLFTLVVLSALLLAACRPSTEQAPEAEEPQLLPVSTFVDAFENALDETTQELGHLEARLETVAAQTDQAFDESLTALQDELDKLQQDLRRLSEASEAAAVNQREALADRYYRLEAELETLRMQMIESREDLESALSTGLDQIDAELQELEAQTAQAEPDMEQAYTGAVDELRMQYRDLRQELDSLQVADEERFAEMRRDVTRALVQLKAEMSELSDRMNQLLDPRRLRDSRMQASVQDKSN